MASKSGKEHKGGDAGGEVAVHEISLLIKKGRKITCGEGEFKDDGDGDQVICHESRQ